jgi:hypothetical protein
MEILFETPHLKLQKILIIKLFDKKKTSSNLIKYYDHVNFSFFFSNNHVNLSAHQLSSLNFIVFDKIASLKINKLYSVSLMKLKFWSKK